MNILVIDNAAMCFQNGKHYTNSLNGIFIGELLERQDTITYFQFETSNGNNISNYSLEEHGVQCRSLRFFQNKIVRYLYAYFMAIFAIMRKEFVYIYYPNSFKYVPLICRLLRKPYGLYIRGMKGLDDRMSHYNYRHAFTILTVSDVFTKRINQLCGSEKAHTIRPMIPYTESDVIRNREYHQKRNYDILYLGRIAADKGLDELLHAAVQLRENGWHRFHMQIVGDGEYMPRLKELHKELELTDYVSIEGPILDDEKKKASYLHTDLYVLPTYHEGFPRTLYEAMIFGTPIITTLVGGIPSLMKDGVNCLSIEPHNVGQLAEKMAYLMDNYATLAPQLAKNAQETVLPIISSERESHAEQLHRILTQREAL